MSRQPCELQGVAGLSQHSVSSNTLIINTTAGFAAFSGHFGTQKLLGQKVPRMTQCVCVKEPYTIIPSLRTQRTLQVQGIVRVSGLQGCPKSQKKHCNPAGDLTPPPTPAPRSPIQRQRTPAMTTEMIERVARALTERCGVDPDDMYGGTYDGGSYSRGKPAWTAWADDARAAIEAMREPTEEMISAANRNNHPRDIDTWHTMIDAALGPA